MLRRCAACHDGNTPAFVGIEIPFTDPVALRRKLRFEPSLTSAGPLLNEMLARISARLRNPMPPASAGAPLSDQDRRELAEYLSALAAQPR